MGKSLRWMAGNRFQLQLPRVLTRDVSWLEGARLNLSFELIHSTAAVLISKFLMTRLDLDLRYEEILGTTKR